MTITVRIEKSNGLYVASVGGEPSLRAEAPTREAAIGQLESEVARLVDRGELVTIRIPQTGVTSFTGIFKDDPALNEIVAEAYRQRDAERPR
ncbi:MAG TPA: hypothetical protein VKD90_00275 [Gemmataceae bacterium]|nr:hypothetical protein [Gemmataceae bacterium]